MGITTTPADRRETEVREGCAPERAPMPSRYGSIIEQLENDQLLETQGDELERAYRRGHNHGIRHALDLLRVEQGLAELASAHVIRTVDLGGDL